MEEIKQAVEYCLNCVNKPCSNEGCPLNNDIPAFIKCVKEDKIEEAYRILSKTTVLESVCGRICPHFSQCMGKCVRGIKGEPVNIGKLEAFVGDMAIKNNYKMDEVVVPKNGKRIAIVGSGPAGLTCAAFLTRSGFEVTIFEKNNYLGGILRHGIPEFRLDRKILDDTINRIISLGINVEYNKELGKNITLTELQDRFDSVFISIGANIPWKMGIPGEELNGVYGGNSLLEYNLHPDYTDKKVAVIGGGNVAMDCARTIKRLGAKNVSIVYRRAKEQMPAEEIEIVEAEKEGIEFLYKTNVIKVIGNNTNEVCKIECIKTELVQKEGDSRLSPVNIEGSNFELDMDYVVMAIGSMPDENVISTLGLELNKKGYIQVDENYETSIKNVYAGGDVAGGKATVAWAARAGRDVAEIIKKDVTNKLVW